jgi:pullulanase/glycogen debranching enzyme
MIKMKICDGCKLLKVIWKSSGTGGKRYCQQCWSAHNQPKKPTAVKKPILPRSPKKVVQDAVYSVLRIKFLKEHSMCEAHLTGCTQSSTDVHHKRGRIGTLLTDIKYWLAVCRHCHDWIEKHPEESKEKGLSLDRLKEPHTPDEC